MLTNEDVLKDRIKTLEGELKYIYDGKKEIENLKSENKVLKSKIVSLEKRIKHLIKELEFE